VALTHTIAAKPDYLEANLLRSQLDFQSGNASLVVASVTNILKQRPQLLKTTSAFHLMTRMPTIS